MPVQALNDLVQGLHHITLVTANQEVNRKFYTEVLGLRRVKLTVNQDDVFHRHLFYADEKGSTGSAITFFEWPELPRGYVGLGSAHHLSYTIPTLASVPKWVSWLRSKGVSVVGPLARDGRVSAYLRDPDGAIVELAALSDEKLSTEDVAGLAKDPPTVTEIGDDMKLTTFNHASPITTDPGLTVQFFEKFVGLQNKLTLPDPDQASTSIVSIGNDRRPDFLRYLASPSASYGQVGKGSIHHIAMAVEDDSDQLKIMRHLNDVGWRNSGIIDRFWFHSLYFRDPDGNLLEIATKNPGYTADEPQETLGTRLALPRWVEPRREEIEAFLKRTDSDNPGTWPPRYPVTHTLPEALPEATKPLDRR
jgi:glyoxalase family protein